MSFWGYPQAYLYPEDSVLSVHDFSSSPLASFINIDFKRSTSSIYKLDLAGNILWEVPGNDRATLSRGFTRALKATSDGGCIYIHNRIIWSGNNERKSYIYKYDISGILEWSIVLPGPVIGGSIEQEAYDIAVLSSGYACLAKDSIYILDSLGNILRTIDYAGPGKLISFPNGDFFLDIQSFKGRIDSTGAVRYSIPYSVYFRDTTVLIHLNDTLYDLDEWSGNINSGVYCPSNGLLDFLPLKDGGWLWYGANFRIMRYDSNGILLFDRNLNFPKWGMDLIGEQSDGTLMTGGTYLSTGQSNMLEYSSFIFTIDSLGDNPMDSTFQICPGDADGNHVIGISDAVYTLLAQGSAGPSRINGLGSTPFLNLGIDLSTNFTGRFGTGVNHNRSDFDGNGIVDITDANAMTFLGDVCANYLLPFRLGSTQMAEDRIIPYFYCIPDKDTAYTGDTIRYYFIIGDPVTSVDSIFGLAFQQLILPDTQQQNFRFVRVIGVETLNSELGLVADLNSIYRNTVGYQFSYVVGRKDLANAYNIYDTIAYAEFVVNDSSGTVFEFDLQPVQFQAITAGGFPITFNHASQPVHIITGPLTGINSPKDKQVKVFPNPVKNELWIDRSEAHLISYKIFDVSGRMVQSGGIDDNNSGRIDVSGITEGQYWLIAETVSGALLRSSFIRQ